MLLTLFALLHCLTARAQFALDAAALYQGIAMAELKWRVGFGTKPKNLVLKQGSGKGRTIFRMPKLPDSSYYGACGSFHYNPDDDDWIDAYANPSMACGFVDLLQDWKKSFCRDSELGCRIQWGDISHKTERYFSGHKEHTSGFCVDMRPFRLGPFSNTPLYMDDPLFDRDTTRKFILYIKKKYRANPVYFNDPMLVKEGIATEMEGHDNHLHFCLQSASTVNKTCKALVVDDGACPFFETDEMQ